MRCNNGFGIIHFILLPSVGFLPNVLLDEKSRATRFNEPEEVG
jgi:hypothetical protein